MDGLGKFNIPERERFKKTCYYQQWFIDFYESSSNYITC